jgi:predicted transcriptional regulator
MRIECQTVARRYDLRTARKRAGLTQEQLARRAGLRQSFVSRLESGDTDPRLSAVQVLARVLRMDVAAKGFRFVSRDIAA